MKKQSALRRRLGVVIFLSGASLAGSVAALTDSAQAAPPVGQNGAATPYAPYAFLIGDWDTVPADGKYVAAIRQTLRWGPLNTYISYSAFTRAPGDAQERLHAEGLMTYNAQHKTLDFLFAHEPGTFGEEEGTVHLEPDGSVVRESTEVEKDGSLSHSRQVIRQTGPNTAVTSLMELRPDGTWAPAFPGSDHLVMVRRAP